MKKNVFFRYLGYRLKNAAFRTLVLTVLSVMLALVVISNNINDYAILEENEFVSTGIEVFAFVLGAVCTLIPILENMEFKNRRNLDTLYFFPIKRVKMAFAHFLGGFMQVMFIYTVTFAASGIYLGVNTDFFALSYLVPYYFLTLLFGLVMYSFFSFIFMQANTVADGVIMSVLWMFALWVAATALFVFAEREGIFYSYEDEAFRMSDWGLAYVPITYLTEIFRSLIEMNRLSSYAQIYFSELYFFIIWGVVGIACAIGYFITFVKKSAHRAGEISDSLFGYRLLIPLYGYSFMLITYTIDIITVLVFMMMIIGYIIYRRSFKPRISDFVVTALAVIPLMHGIT